MLVGQDRLSEELVLLNIRQLPEVRRERCIRYQRVSDRKNCVLAYLLLLAALQERYGISSPVELIYNKYGKPYLKDYPHIFFNLSHCKTGIACAVADFEIGVDVQEARAFNLKIAEKACCDSELEELKASGDPSWLFCKMWTEKESLCKAMGVSLASVLCEGRKTKWSAKGQSLHWDFGILHLALSSKDAYCDSGIESCLDSICKITVL